MWECKYKKGKRVIKHIKNKFNHNRQAMYPSLISDESSKWAERVMAGVVIQKKHDLEMLEKLFN